jgi:polysaccharide export outer membrane protein
MVIFEPNPIQMLSDSMNFIHKRCANFILIRRGFKFIFFPLFCTLLLFSCTSSKDVTYFNDLSDSLLVKLPDRPQPEAVIMPDDVLAIRFAGENKTTEAAFNSFAISSQSNQGAEYHVNSKGNIDIYQIGTIKAAGLTRDGLRQLLLDSISRYLKSPNVTVRFVNFRFTVLGEVRSPGSFVVSRENVTILEALGQAGDMTQYASRNSVRVIRDSSGKREIGMIDFNQKTVFTSPYYFLQRNDVVYVTPQKSKSDYESVTRITSIVGTVLGILAVTLTILNLK